MAGAGAKKFEVHRVELSMLALDSASRQVSKEISETKSYITKRIMEDANFVDTIKFGDLAEKIGKLETVQDELRFAIRCAVEGTPIRHRGPIGEWHPDPDHVR